MHELEVIFWVLAALFGFTGWPLLVAIGVK